MAANASSTAAYAVGTITELAEQVLLEMPADSIIKAIRVCRQWRDIIQRPASKIFKEAMFMVAEKSLDDLDLERWYLDPTLRDANIERYVLSGCQQDVALTSAFVCISELSPEEKIYLVNDRKLGKAYPTDDGDVVANTITPVRLNPVLEDRDGFMEYGWTEYAAHGRIAKLPYERLQLDTGNNTRSSWRRMHLTQPPTPIEIVLTYNDVLCDHPGCNYGNGGHPRIERPGVTRLGDLVDELTTLVGEMNAWDWAHSSFTIRNIAVPDDKEREEVRNKTLELKREYAEKMEIVRRVVMKFEQKVLEQRQRWRFLLS